MKLMLGDDDMDDIELFHEAVREIKPDAELIISNNGRQLLSKLQTEVPAVIFLDINMPEMNGWECLRYLKHNDGLKHIPVVMYTTSSAKRDIEIARDMGAYKLVTKPDRFQELLTILSGILTEIGN